MLSEHTLGSDVVTFSEDVCGIELMPWQAWLFERALELSKPWVDLSRPPSFRYRTVCVLVARQNGKTTMLKLRALAGLMLWREQLAISLAQTRTVAFEPWREGALLVKDVPALARQVKHVRTSNGSEAIELNNGSRWLVVSGHADSARGFSADCVLMDEVRLQKTRDVWSSVEKTRSAKPTSQLWAFSNAGDDDSVVLNSLVERGRELAEDPERDPTFGYFEWSADDGCDPADQAQWQKANPALGFTIMPATVKAELVQDTPEAFLTERLCVRVRHLGSWLPHGLWQSLAGDVSISTSNVVFAVDASPDLLHAVVVAASPRDDGTVALTLFASSDATPGRPVAYSVQDQVQRLLTSVPGAQVVYDARGPIAATLGDMAAAGFRCMPMDATEVNRACERFYELAVSRKIVHDGSQLLADHVSNAAPNTYNDAWKFARRHAAGPVNALIAAVLAAHVARAPKPAVPNWTAY